MTGRLLRTVAVLLCLGGASTLSALARPVGAYCVLRAQPARPALSRAAAAPPRRQRALAPLLSVAEEEGSSSAVASDAKDASDEEGWTLEKVAKLGIAGVLSIAVAETVFWVLSFPTSELVYYIATGEWIDLFSQEGQVKFLAFTVGWGGIGGIIAQYRTVLTAAAMTPWMDREVVQPYVKPWLESVGIADKFEFARKDGDDAAAEESEAPAEAAPFEMPKFELPKDLSLPKLPEGFELPKLPKF